MNPTDDGIRCYSQSDQLVLRMTRHGARRSTASVRSGVSVKRIATLVRRNLEATRAVTKSEHRFGLPISSNAAAAHEPRRHARYSL